MTLENTLKPILESQKQAVVAETNRRIDEAGILFNMSLPYLPVTFDLKGKCAGMYKAVGDHRLIRFNPWLFAKYFEESFSNTVPHEVAHYVVHMMWGSKGIKPHGREWRDIMLALGVSPKATNNYDLDGVPKRSYRRYRYRCGCKMHELTIIRHKKIVHQGARYYCKSCHGILERD